MIKLLIFYILIYIISALLIATGWYSFRYLPYPFTKFLTVLWLKWKYNISDPQTILDSKISSSLVQSIKFLPLLWLLESSGIILFLLVLGWKELTIYHSVSIISKTSNNKNKSMKRKDSTTKSGSVFVGLKLYADIFKAGAMVSLSNAKHLMAVLKKVGKPMAIITLLSTREVNRFTLVHNFGIHILKIHKKHGDTFTVKYLKACQLAIQKKLAGTPFVSLREVEPKLPLPRLTTGGLPAFIRLQDRRSIGMGSVRIVRFWLSLLSVYRILKAPLNPNLSTITDPFKGDLVSLEYFNNWLSSKTISKITNFKIDWSPTELAPDRLVPIMKSSSLGGPSFKYLFHSVLLLQQNVDIWIHFKEYIKLSSSKWFENCVENILYALSRNPSFRDKVQSELDLNSRAEDGMFLGKLSFKEEAAGKLRVFAMVDVMTQSLLKPLHDKLFSFLGKLPNDGTFDQDKAFKYATELSLRYNACYAFDLSSATDRLPISSQKVLLNTLFKVPIGEAWAGLLVGRSYHVTKNSYGIPIDALYYSVGQPMGALSSWAMLALTHHMMVQFAADQSGKSLFTDWYKDYVVLGDDLVIFDKAVADCYLALCKGIGVSINMSKSVIAPSKPVVEFAKRTSINGVDVSPLSFKEFITSNNFFGRLGLTTRLIRRGYGKDMWKLFVLSSRGNLEWSDIKYPIIGYLTQLALSKKKDNNVPFELSDLLCLITDKGYPLSYFGRNISWLKSSVLVKVMRSILNGTWSRDLVPYTDRKWSAIRSDSYKLVLIKKIFTLVDKIKDFHPPKIAYLAREYCVNTPLETLYYRNRVDNGLSLELSDERNPKAQKLLTSRSYFKDMLVHTKEKDQSLLNRCFAYYFSPEIYKNHNFKMSLLRLGADVDLSRTRIISDMIRIMPLMESRKEMELLVKSKAFAEISLNELLQIHERLTNIVSDMMFFNKPLVRSEHIIDNPLKALDFIKESQKPEFKSLFKLKSDFLYLEGKVVDSVFVNMDHQPGFRPKFNFKVGLG